MTTLAAQAILRWEKRTNPVPFRMIAHRVDRNVEIKKYSSDLAVYAFSDGSSLTATGRTVNFTIRHTDQKELAELIAVEQLFSGLRTNLS